MLILHDVSYSHPGQRMQIPALDRVSLTVKPGERLVVLGSNGSGKSTLARVAAGSLVPTSGTVSVGGLELTSETRNVVRQRAGLVRQDPRLQVVCHLVRDEVAFGPRNLMLPREEVLKRVDEALITCGIADLAYRPCGELSGGQLQLVAIASALALNPQVLVLDEVAAHIDAAARERIGTCVEALRTDGRIVLEMTHHARGLIGATKVMVLRQGQSVWEGTPLELLSSKVARRLSGLDDDPATALLVRAVEAGWNPAAAGAREALRSFERPASAKLCSTHIPAGSELCAHEVSVKLGDVQALKDVTLTARGTTLIGGAPGSGKSTAARVLSGVTKPDSGSVALDGALLVPGMVGLAFQRPQEQLFADTVLDDVAFGLRARGIPEEEALAQARIALVRMGVAEELFSVSPLCLSGGQERRVALAGVLATKPQAYVFDEPTAGLDPAGRRAVRELVSALAAEGHPVVVVSHDAEEWLPSAHTVVQLEKGCVVDKPTFAAPADNQQTAPVAVSVGAPPIRRVPLRSQLVALLLACIACIGSARPQGQILALAGALVLIACSGVRMRAVMRGMLPAIALVLIAFISNTLTSAGGLALSAEGVTRGLLSVARVAAFVGLVLAQAATAGPDEAVEALASLVPRRSRADTGAAAQARSYAGSPALMAAAVAVRNVPNIVEEIERIRLAQLARSGAQAQRFSERLRSWTQVLVPLLVGLSRRANELASAMADRLYTGEQTPMLNKVSPGEVALMLLAVAWCVACLVL